MPQGEKLNLEYTICDHCLKEEQHLQTIMSQIRARNHNVLIQNIKREFLNTNTWKCSVWFILKREKERKDTDFHIQIFIYCKLSFNILLARKLHFFSKLEIQNFKFLMLFLNHILRIRFLDAAEAVSLGRLGYSCVICVTTMYINMNITGVFCAGFLKEVPTVLQNTREMWV